uniref:Uncharacterized protein n=1 Tax=Lactuca sativa TaxID=4236 RepID=A0A9R1XDG9_LACSA|nr:hypothetical protein LSAT_V11C500259160 [Lactuca sativa]
MCMVNHLQFHPQYGSILGDKINLCVVYRLWETKFRRVSESVICNRTRGVFEPQCTKVNVEEVNDESISNNINFDEQAKFQTSYSFDEKASDTLYL